MGQRRRVTPLTVVCAAGLLASLGLAVAATRHVPVAASSPLHPTGSWRGALIGGLAGAFAAYVIALALALRGSLSRTVAAGIGCAAQLLPLISPLLLSTDAYTYWAYGRLAAHYHANPYAVPPSAHPGDPSYAAMGGNWHHSTTIYGPLFTWISHFVGYTSSAHTAQLSFRVVAAASMVAIVFLLWMARAPAVAIVLAGWSPVFALHFAGGGHNDALMLLFVVGALLAGPKRPWLSSCLWVAAVAVKWVALVLIALDLLAGGVQFWRSRLTRLLVVGAAGVALTLVAYGTAWKSAFSGLSEQSRRTGSLGAARWLHELGLQHREVVALLDLLLLALIAALAVLAVRRGSRHLSLAGTGVAALQGWLNPWYAVWGGATLAFEETVGLAVVANVALGAIVLRDALPL